MTHGVFYCTECSRYFQGDAARDDFHNHRHHETRICVDIECSNKQEENLYHTRVDGCKDLRFGRQKTSRKWYSLFRIALPDDPLPPWSKLLRTLVLIESKLIILSDDVEVNTDVNQLVAATAIQEGEMVVPSNAMILPPAMDQPMVETLLTDEAVDTLEQSSFHIGDETSVSEFSASNRTQQPLERVVESLRNEIVNLRDGIVNNYAARFERLEQPIHLLGDLVRVLTQQNNRLDQQDPEVTKPYTTNATSEQHA